MHPTQCCALYGWRHLTVRRNLRFWPSGTNPQAGGASSWNFWTSTIQLNFLFIIGILRLRAIDWYINEFNRRRSGGGGVGGFRLFGTPPPEFYWGIFFRNYNYIFRILSSSPVDGHPFWVNWVKGGVCGHFQKSQAHALGAGRGVSQANEAAIYPKFTEMCQHEIVSGILKK